VTRTSYEVPQLRSLLQPPVTSSFLGPNILLSTLYPMLREVNKLFDLLVYRRYFKRSNLTANVTLTPEARDLLHQNGYVEWYASLVLLSSSSSNPAKCLRPQRSKT